MVIIIMGIIASVAMKSLGSGLRSSRIEETKTELRTLASAIAGNPELYSNGVRTDFGYIGDVGSLPANLDALVTNPGYGTWNGPYIKSDFLSYADDFKKDAWGGAYAYSGGNTITSYGGSQDTMEYVLTSATSDYSSNSVLGNIYDAGGNPPGDSASNVTITLRYPNGAGGYKDSTLNPNSSGYFNFASTVPIGNQTLTAIYASTNDTVISFVSVPPKSDVITNLRFPGSLWASAGGGGGGGGGSATIEYKTGSAAATGGGKKDIEFEIINDSDDGINVTWMKVTYSVTAYYKKIKWDDDTVFDNDNPRAASGQSVGFSSSKTLPPHTSGLKIKIQGFKSQATGGSNVNMENRDITVEFSDGSVITFNTND